MKTPECIKIEQWIVADFDEGLSTDAREVLESHLERCESCRKIRDDTARLFAALVKDVPTEPTEDFWKEHEASLQAEILRKELQRTSRKRWKAVTIGLAAAVAFIAVWVGYFDPAANLPSSNEAALPAVIEELDRAYGPVSECGAGLSVLADATLTAATIPALRSDTVAEWFATEYDPLMLWL